MAPPADAHLLIAKLDDVRVLTTMLKTIHFKDTAMVWMLACLTAAYVIAHMFLIL